MEYTFNPYYVPYAITKPVGGTVSLTATGTGGISPYTATFRQTGGLGTIITDTALTAHYVVIAADAGKTITFYAKVTDSCSPPQTSPEVLDTVAVTCTVPSCGLTMA